MKTIRVSLSAFLIAVLLLGMLPARQAAAVENESDYMSMEEAAAYVRKELKEFKSGLSFKFCLEDPNFYTEHAMMFLFMEEVLKHTGVPDEGDYMRWSFQQYGFDLEDYFDGKTHYVSVTNFIPRYNNSAQQEEMLDRKVEEVLASLDLEGKSDYEKIRAIYTYICENIVYSVEYLNSENDPWADTSIYFTAYNALVHGSTTCQGFSQIVYRMMLEAGIDCRVIAGDTGGTMGHGWNIVELDGVYYYLEPTDDSAIIEGGGEMEHFLDGSASFRIEGKPNEDGLGASGSERRAWVDYYTAEFLEEYPISVLDYGQPELLTGDADQVLGSGRCGNGANWTLTADGTLTLSGAGPTWDGDILGFSNGARAVPRWDNLNGYIKRVEIQEGITSIGNYAFANCPRLNQVSIPASVKSIGGFAFGLCESLTEITLPDTVETLGKEAFYQCVGLESATLFAGMKEIPEQAFVGCTSLKSVHIPEGIQTIRNAAFLYCTGLQGLEIPSSVTVIADMAFAHAFDPAAEVTLVVPETVTELGGACFEASGLYRVEVKAPLQTLGLMMFNQCDNLQSVELPDTIQAFEGYAFADCANLRSVRLPSGLTDLGETAFQFCSGLQSVELPGTLEKIPNGTFIQCRSLEEIVIPGSVERIGGSAFEECTKLKKVTISDGVKRIGSAAFGGCLDLEIIVFEGDAPEIGDAIFGLQDNRTVYYPRDNVTWTQEYMKKLVVGSAEYIGDGWMAAFATHNIDDPHTLGDDWHMDEYGHWKKCR